MARKGESIYKRKDGQWEGGVINPQGKYQRFYAGTYQDIRAKMESLQEQNKAANQEPVYVQTSTTDSFEKWLTDDTASHLKPSTYESHHYCVQGYVVPYFSLPENARSSERSITVFIRSIHGNGAISGSYQKKVLSILKTALREISKKSPEYMPLIETVTLPKVKPRTKIPIFSMKGQRLIEYTVQSSVDQKTLGTVLYFYTGIRLGELCVLRWGDIDSGVNTISISRSVTRTRDFEPDGDKTQFYIGIPKNRTSYRKIPLPVFLLEFVEESHLGPIIKNCHVLSGSTEPFNPRVHQRLYKGPLKRAGIQTHEFRAICHTFATKALKLGVDIKILGETLGRSSVSITPSVYVHSLMEQKEGAIEELNEMHVAHMGAFSFAVSSAVMAAIPAVQTRNLTGGRTVLDELRRYITVSQFYYILCKEENSGEKPVQLIAA